MNEFFGSRHCINNKIGSLFGIMCDLSGQHITNVVNIYNNTGNLTISINVSIPNHIKFNEQHKQLHIFSKL
jgi:hypothetical protein